MKFKHRITGMILEPHDVMTIEQMKKSDVYKEVKTKETKEIKNEAVEETKENKKKKK